jgi:spermidine synthase
MFSGQNESATGRVYAYETAGTVIGGIVCTYLIIPYLDTFQAISGLAVLNTVICLTFFTPHWKNPRYQRILAILSLFSILFLVLTSQSHRLHQYTIQTQWKNQNIVHYQNSQYGNICVIENEGQYISSSRMDLQIS